MRKNETTGPRRVVPAREADRVALWRYNGGDPKSTSVRELP